MGNELLLLAGILSGLCAIFSFLSDRSGKLKTTLRILWGLSAVLIFSAVALMIFLQITCRFEYQYVYNHISTDMNLAYKISALWAGQEGSFLLWALVQSVFGFFVLFSKSTGKSSKTFGLYLAISFCIFIMCYITMPFAKLGTVPTDGLGLTEALKDPWMVIHPPLVFASYSAMAILFSLSAAISEGNHNSCADRMCFWLKISWIFLGAGIFSGSIWAYRALGWGGYWAWDPIENAALVPWLILCGYLHNKRCNLYQVCIVPFSVACFGTFLARSGILQDQSAHAYSDGNAIITGIILGIILVSVLILIITKLRHRKEKKSEQKVPMSDMRIFNYIIIGYAALIFLGTIAPIFLNIETPILYYTIISVIFVLSYSILLLVHDLKLLKKRCILMAIISTVIVIAIMAAFGSDHFLWLILLWVCLMPVSLWLASGFSKGWKYYLTHLGVLLLITGAIGSSALSHSGKVIVQPNNDQAVISGVAVPLGELSNGEVLIKSLPLKDLIIRCSDILNLGESGYLVPYETKPMIILFWIGGGITIIAPLFLMASVRFKKCNNSVCLAVSEGSKTVSNTEQLYENPKNIKTVGRSFKKHPP